MYIDTHAHITSDNYENIKEVIDNAKNNNVCKIINCADNLKTCYEVIELSKLYPNILYPAIGIHPESLQDYSKKNLHQIEKMIIENKIIAIGEIGLDYHYNKKNKIKQKRMFKSFLRLAQKYNLPVLIHSRDTNGDTLKILRKYKVTGIIHCFSESLDMALEYIKLGYSLGIGGTLTFKKSEVKEIVEKIDLNKIVLETDSPYLSPEPIRGRKNESKNIPLIAKKLSEIKGKNVDEIEKITTDNACTIFDF